MRQTIDNSDDDDQDATEVVAVEIDSENDDEATLYVEEQVTDTDRTGVEIHHSHIWTCEVTREGEVNTPMAAGEDVRETAEAYEVDWTQNESEAREVTVAPDEVVSEAEDDETHTYDSDGYTVYASQLVHERDGETEVREAVVMADRTVIRIDTEPQTTADSTTGNGAVATDGGQETEETRDTIQTTLVNSENNEVAEQDESIAGETVKKSREVATEFDTNVDVGGVLLDGHELTERARAYAHHVINTDAYPMGAKDVDLSRVEWATSTRMQSKHGHAGYGRRAEECEYYIHLSAKSYENAGWDFIAETIRHELIHIWQYQRKGKLAVIGDGGVEEATYPAEETSDEDWQRLGDRFETGGESVVRPSGGHGADFRAWCDAMDVDGRTSSYDADLFEYYRYPLYCPGCHEIINGRHRFCSAIRQRACAKCDEPLVVARRREGVIEWLDGVMFSDDEIRAFADGEVGGTWSDFVICRQP